MITATSSLTELFDTACLSANDLEKDEIFLVRDLFRGFEWKRIPVGNRTKLGSMFFNHVQHNAFNQFEPLGKTPQNQQMYKKR